MRIKKIWTKIKDSLIRPVQDKKNTNRIGMVLSNNYVLPILIILIDLLLFFLFNYLINGFVTLFRAFFSGTGEYTNVLVWKNIFPNWEFITSSNTATYIYLFFAVLLIILDGFFIYQMKTSLSDDYFNQGQKGDSRFRTIEEIQQVYKEIPDKDKSFPGRGGTVISRYKDKLYIDPIPMNNLIIGMTGSGKDEFYVFSSIDIYSRAEEQTSMVVFDPKTEDYRSSAATLRKRGYDVYFLNLDQPIKSMKYNPLTLITEYYKKEQYDDAEMLADSFAYSIYSPDDSKLSGNEKFFNQSAASILSGLVLAHIKDCLEADAHINEQRFITFQKKQKAYSNLSEAQKAEVRLNITSIDEAIDNEDIRYIPDNFLISDVNMVHKYEKCINMYSILNLIIELSNIHVLDSEDTMLDIYFKERPPLDPGKIRYASAMVAGDRTKGSILSTLINGLNVFTNKAIAKMTSSSTLNFDDIGFGDRPVAIFLGVPDYDRSKWFLATIFIKQAYYYLAQKCARINGKCKTPVKFICNEFGNQPPIDDMSGIITVCRARNITFDMYIQAFAQLAEKYGDKVQETIEGNCGNIIYILSSSKETSEKISDLVGHRTRKIMQRSGQKLSLNKHFIENLEQEPLIYPETLRKLHEGECIVIPTMHRKDLNGNDIREEPIFNSIETGTNFKYRYQYLTDTFPNPDTVPLDSVNPFSCADVDPQKLIWDNNLSFDSYFKKRQEPELLFKHLPKSHQRQIITLVKDALGTDFDKDMFLDDVPLYKILIWIQSYLGIDSFVKQTVIDLLLLTLERGKVNE